jgi:hypothetical protein
MPICCDPFTVLCPICLSPIDATDPAVEIEYAANFAATAVCPTCRSILPLSHPEGVY